MLELEEALARVLAAVPEPSGETVPLVDALGRVVREDVHSSLDLPPFNNSAMDGYAVRAADLAAARADCPARLRLIGKVAAGQSFKGEIASGTCVRLFTGSPIPRGADAVVMQEDTKPDSADPTGILVFDRAKEGENVRGRGEDISAGALLVRAGTRVSFAQLSLLAAAGTSRVKVGRQPRVAVLATGSELKEAGTELAEGQIYESNRVALAGLIRSAGGLPTLLPLVTDDLASTRAALSDALDHHDAAITSGGASVGDMDFVKQAIQEEGGRLEFWKVAIKPGRPFVFGSHGAKLIFGLPGNPVSALVTFLLLVRPALLCWQGATDLALPSHPAVLAEPVSNPGNRRHFIRVRIAPDGAVRSAGTQASHALSSLALANGLLDVAPETVLAEGSTVRVLRWG